MMSWHKKKVYQFFALRFDKVRYDDDMTFVFTRSKYGKIEIRGDEHERLDVSACLFVCFMTNWFESCIVGSFL